MRHLLIFGGAGLWLGALTGCDTLAAADARYDRAAVVSMSADTRGDGKATVAYSISRRPAPSLYAPHADAPGGGR